MKANSTRELKLKKSVLFILFALLVLLSLSKVAVSQPDYYFNAYTKVSGTTNAVNSVYRFTNVRPGLDALVTITAITGGITIANLDGGSGYNDAIQPVIDVPAGANGYAEFDVDFVTAGTNNGVNQAQVPITPIDVDGGPNGGGMVYEYDMIRRTGSSYVDYNMATPELTVTIANPWVTGKNIGGVDYPGIDTSKKQVMFTVVNNNVSKITFRVGAQNTGGSSVQRLRSVYFKKFSYANSFLLPLASIKNFKANLNNKQTDLQWQLNSSKDVSTIVIERATQPSQFQPIGEVWVDGQVSNDKFSFKDNLNNVSSNVVYYRLRVVKTNGTVEYSTVVTLRTGSVQNSELTFYPTVFNDRANINIGSTNGGAATIQIADYSGRIVSKKDINLQKGYNNITLDNLGSLSSGNYIAIVRSEEGVLTKKVMKQ